VQAFRLDWSLRRTYGAFIESWLDGRPEALQAARARVEGMGWDVFRSAVLSLGATRVQAPA